MSEIEKMYKNADVDYEERYNNCTLNKEGECKLKCSCDICKYSEEKYIYPPFTAEKQIELIKWLCQKTYRNYLLIKYNFTNYYWQIECNMTDSDRVDNFSEAIANLVNNLWQDLTEEEHKQIKEILE